MAALPEIPERWLMVNVTSVANEKLKTALEEAGARTARILVRTG